MIITEDEDIVHDTIRELDEDYRRWDLTIIDDNFFKE